MAKVYKVERLSDGRLLAMKYVSLSKMTARDLRCIRTEAEMLRRLEHPNIVKMERYYEADTHAYLTMELGEIDLFDYLQSAPSACCLGEKGAATVIQQVASALQHLHACQIVHRDVKPENLLMFEDGLKLCDFGLSSSLLGRRKKLEAICGTIDYCAPEVLRKQPYDCSSDIWSMGVVLYILLCGRPPFDPKYARCLIEIGFR